MLVMCQTEILNIKFHPGKHCILWRYNSLWNRILLWKPLTRAVPPRMINVWESLLGITPVIILQEHAHTMLTQKPNVLCNVLNLCKAGINEMRYPQATYRQPETRTPCLSWQTSRAKTLYYQHKHCCMAYWNKSAATKPHPCAQGLSNTPTTNVYCSLLYKNFSSLGWFFCCCWNFLSKNDKRKIRRPMWKYYEGYTYRSETWAILMLQEKWLQNAVCIPPANGTVKRDAFFMKHPCNFRTSLYKTTCKTRSSEDTDFIMHLWKGKHKANQDT